MNIDKALSIFCNAKGIRFSNVQSEKIKWKKNNTDLGFFFREMIYGKTKIISDKEIWVKVSNHFLDRNGNKIKPNSISVASQSKNPKNKKLIKKIIDSIIIKNFN